MDLTNHNLFNGFTDLNEPPIFPECFTEIRKSQIADLAEQYGLLSLPLEDICSVFHKISSHHI